LAIDPSPGTPFGLVLFQHPIALLPGVQQKTNETPNLHKRITALETRLDEGNEEIKRLEGNQAAEKERIVRLEEDLRAADEKKQRADQENRDLRGEMEQLRKNRADNEQADERDFKLEQQIQREKRKADTYQRTQKDLQFQIADLAVCCPVLAGKAKWRSGRENQDGIGAAQERRF
jgi:hypothetical protein